MGKYFGTDGIRGTVGKELTVDLALKVGKALSYFEEKDVYIGYDTRISNHMIPFYNSKYYQNLPTFLKQDIDKLHEIDLAAH